jgi:phospholipid/cholesterol/gamma-HCH transport system substrate-binding protein
MEPKVSYTLVGLFVVVLGAVLFSTVLWLSQEGRAKVYDRYRVYMEESVSGLSENAPVKYRGVEVGRVSGITLDPENPERVRLSLDIVQGSPIKEDTVATLSSQGLTGLAFVDLSGGSREAPSLVAQIGEPYPLIQSKPSLLVRMDQAVSSLLTNLNIIATDLHDLVDEESRTSVKKLFVNLADLSEILTSRESQLEQLLSSASRAIRNTEEVSAQLPQLTARMTDSIAAVQGMAQDIADTSKTVNALVRNNQQGVKQFTRQTLSEVGLLVSELRQLTSSLQGLARQLDQEPSTLLFGRQQIAPGPGE